MSKFKVGDTVKHFSSVGEVVAVDGPLYEVRYGDGIKAFVYESELIEADDDLDRWEGEGGR